MADRWRGGAGRTPATPVYRITAAQRSLSDDQRGRTRRYLFSMGLRTVCFLGAIVASGWLRWILVVGAVFLPYVAVVIANAGREQDRDRPPTGFDHVARPVLGPSDPPPDPVP